jgi:hypothetical protein
LWRQAAAASNPFLSSVPDYPLWSAFTAVKWEKNKPYVQIVDSENWYELVEFHGIPIEKILEHCRKNRWETELRVTEDLVQIVRLMGRTIDKKTSLKLRDKDGKLIAMRDVTMTEANLKQVFRTRPTRVDARESATFTRENFEHDLRVFQKSLESQFAYLNANNVDYKAAIDRLSKSSPDKISRTKFSRELQKIMAKFIDGHAGVSGRYSGMANGYLPILIEPSGERFVAIGPDRSKLLDSEFPYIRAIDGIKMERWLAATEPYIAKGSRQYKVNRGLRLLSRIQHFRGLLKIDTREKLKIELASRDGKFNKTITLEIADDLIRSASWPAVQKPGILDGNIGYLRLTSMNDRSTKLLEEWMSRFRDTDGLIVDVRGNGGGIRTPILELASYLVTEKDEPRIGNLAKYRLAKSFREDHLSAARYVYRKSSTKFDDRDRAAIEKFMKTFKPQWNPPENEFSQWHFLVLSANTLPSRFHYDKPVAILLDEGCFSATDIFLGTFKGWPNVKLIGQASSGGSARIQNFVLPRSQINVRCASMASFQPDGKLYDTNGVSPDIPVVRPPEYYIKGGADITLERALKWLKK